MKLSYKTLRLFTVIYATVPIIIFFIGWLSPIVSLIFSVLTISGFVFFIRNKDDGEYSFVEINKKQVIVVAILAVVWCFLAGQGGFVHQTSDHIIRNAIFRDIIKQPWPVIFNDNQLLSYYIAHWMLPAVVGKGVIAISGSISAGLIAGRVALLIWSSIGIFISFLLITVITAHNKARAILSSTMLIFFSGLDIIGTIIKNTSLSHLEWWAAFAQFSSISTCLFWVYNQFIVILPITLCIINEKSTANFAFLGILMFPYGPFPFIGIVMICLLKAIVLLTDKSGADNLSKKLKKTFSPQNLIMLAAVGVPHALYYMSSPIITNDVSRDGEAITTGFRLHGNLLDSIASGNAADIAVFFLNYLLFLFLEVGIYLIILFIYFKKQQCKKTVFWLSSLTLIFIPLFQIGMSYDFAMRVSIPALIYIGVELIRMVNAELPSQLHFKDLRSIINTKLSPLLTATLFVFCIGAVTPLFEFKREIQQTISVGTEKETDYNYLDSLNDYDEKENFASANYEQSLFYKFFLKK